MSRRLTSYVIDKNGGDPIIHHEGDTASCAAYVNTCVSQWGHRRSRYMIAEGAKQRDEFLKQIRNGDQT